MRLKEDSEKTSSKAKKSTSAAAKAKAEAKPTQKRSQLKFAPPKENEAAKPSSGKHHRKIVHAAKPAEMVGFSRHERIAEVAYMNWLARGREHGSHEEDWFRAERVVLSSD